MTIFCLIISAVNCRSIGRLNPDRLTWHAPSTYASNFGCIRCLPHQNTVVVQKKERCLSVVITLCIGIKWRFGRSCQVLQQSRDSTWPWWSLLSYADNHLFSGRQRQERIATKSWSISSMSHTKRLSQSLTASWSFGQFVYPTTEESQSWLESWKVVLARGKHFSLTMWTLSENSADLIDSRVVAIDADASVEDACEVCRHICSKKYLWTYNCLFCVGSFCSRKISHALLLEPDPSKPELGILITDYLTYVSIKLSCEHY